MRIYAKMPLEVRFWQSVFSLDPEPDKCWEWKNTPSQIYGYIKINGKTVKASRVAYEMTYGTIPSGMLVCHKCDNPRCVRPDHLFLGSHTTNVQDCITKNRRGDMRPKNPAKGERSGPQRYPERYGGTNNGRARLNWDKVRQIREEYASGCLNQFELAAKYSVAQTTISAIVRNKIWSE